MQGMATVTEVRHANLLVLIAWAGSIQKLADLLEKSHSQLSQLRNQIAHSTTGKPRVIGDSLAREIEATIGVPPGWMDSPQGPPPVSFEELVRLKAAGIPPTVASGNIPTQSRQVDQRVSYQPFDHPPLTRETIMGMEGELPERFTHVLEDDAMGSFGRAGTEVLFHSASDAKLGAGILVRDKNGEVYVRRKAQGRSGAHWLAVPAAAGGIYRELDSEMDGLTILAVWRGVVNRGLEDL